MTSVASSRTLRLSVLGSFVFAMAATAAAWAAADGRVSASYWWALTLALLASAIAGWLLLRHHAAEVDAATARCVPLQAELDGMQGRLREFSNSQGRFVGNIAHEIKTPLATALGQMDLLLHSSTDPVAVRSYAKSIAEDLRHLSDLVDSFLRLARPFAQEDTSHHVPVDVHDFVVEVTRRCQSLARECGVGVVPTLAERIDGDASVEVYGDAMLLEAMLENLVRNALRFSPRGSRIGLLVEVVGEVVGLRVRDHGAGIAAEHLESVFDWFFQSPGLTLHTSGTGFGLAIARRIAEHHGGTIALRNHPGGGCEFHITLPRYRQAAPPADPTTAHAAPAMR